MSNLKYILKFSILWLLVHYALFQYSYQMHIFIFSTRFYHISPTCFSVLYIPSAERTSNYLHPNAFRKRIRTVINPLNAELNPICHLLALLGAHPVFHVSKIRD